MKIVSKVTLWLGVIIAVVGIGAGAWGAYISWVQFLALDALRSSPVDKPLAQLLVAAIALLLGGFLVGLGVGITPRGTKPAPVPEPVPQPAPEPPPAL